MKRPSSCSRPARLLLTLLLPGFLSQAALATTPGSDPEAGAGIDTSRLQRGTDGRQTWRLNNLKDYVYRIERRCFCPAPSRAEVFVVGGEVVRVKDLEDGRISDDPALLGYFKTIPGLFREIEQAMTSIPDRLTLELDRYLGYPARFSVDPSYRIADDGIRYRIDWLRPLTGDHRTAR